MKVSISGVEKEVLLTGLYKFATVQGIGHIEQLALGSSGKPFLKFSEAYLLNQYQKNQIGSLSFTNLFGKYLFVDITADEVDFTAYDFHNGSGLGSFVVGLARSNPSFLSAPLSPITAELQLFCAMNACYQEIPIPEFNALITDGKYEEFRDRLYRLYRKNIENHVGFPLTVVSKNRNTKIVNSFSDKTSRAPHEVREDMGCFYQETAIEEMPAQAVFDLCEKQLDEAVAHFGQTHGRLFNSPIVRRDTRKLPLITQQDYALFFLQLPNATFSKNSCSNSNTLSARSQTNDA